MVSVSVQQEVIKQVSDSAKGLLTAYNTATKANPMAENLPVFQRLLQLQKELGAVMQEISKVRGL